MIQVKTPMLISIAHKFKAPLLFLLVKKNLLPLIYDRTALYMVEQRDREDFLCSVSNRCHTRINLVVVSSPWRSPVRQRMRPRAP